MKKIVLFSNVFLIVSSHAVVFFIWAYFLSIRGFLALLILLEILSAAMVFIVLSFMLIRYVENYFTRALYLSASLWIGWTINTILVASILVTLDLILYIFSLAIPFDIQQKIIIIIPLVLIFIELYNALVYKIKKYDVKIPDLPKFWEGKKIIHLSDIHLGPIYRNETYRRIINRVNQLNADLLVVTGDLFDGIEADFSWLDSLHKKIKVELGTYYILGNHELDMGKEKALSLLRDTPIIVLDNKAVVVEGLQILGITSLFREKMDFNKIVKKTSYQEGKPSILLIHEPRCIKEARKIGINLQLSGHTHAGQIFPGSLLMKILYHGYYHGLYKKKNHDLIVSAGTGTGPPPLRLGNHSEIILITLHKK